MADTAQERWVLEHDGHRLEVEGPRSRTTRHLRLFVDGEQVAEQKVTGNKTTRITHGDTTVRAEWDRLGHLAVVALLPAPGDAAALKDVNDIKDVRDLDLAGLKELVTGGGEIWFTPPPGSRAERRERFARRHPRLFAARHVAAAVAKVLLPLLGLAGLIRIPMPDIDLPALDLPDLDPPRLRRPRIPWPDIDLSWLPDITLPGWVQAVVRSAKYWGPILAAVVIALREYERRKRQRDKQRHRHQERQGEDTARRPG
ncbi:hypothetical protein Acsp03_08210 [Actinomadura sp. NBRC 104412]|uniref:hypothetical protein n=1 Tax=Actinomadura sp. NBRC 104412 TaxID=3032203 RepID=UPI0024A429E5|nr:hypothetical protein [Actinomadura sp. NBRC 104412]GLZ03354.1 hypothetical protein Acsp03_08210 [Actinomadura sp. NBRC 104412]